MRTRVEGLLDRDCRTMWISTFHALCARLLRREAHHLGLSRSFTIYDSADQQAVVKQLVREYQLDDSTYQPRMILSRISHAKNRMEGPETFADTWNPRDKRDRPALLRLSQGPDRRQRARLRRPAAQDGRALRPGAGGARALRAPLPLRDDRRVPGHQPAAVPAGEAAGERARQPVRGRRSRPVDLQVARRRRQEHPRLRARLPRRRHGEARTQLPLDAGDPRRRVGGGESEPRPQGQGAVDRPGRRRADCHLSRRRRARRGRLHRPDDPARLRRRRPIPPPPSSIAPTPSRAPSKTACARPAFRMRCSAVRGSTSARRSRTRWRI